MKTRLTLLAALGGALALGCGSEEAPDQEVVDRTREELLNPETCKECHSEHYEEWSGSMHAYAADDPIFLAMNARGQEETGGALGDFCVSCHAPMAVREGATTDGLNLAEVPAHLKGVTCYFCHNVADVEGEHNAALRLADDLTMRGGIRDPVKTGGAHRSAYSPFLDRNRRESADACGACHDILTPAGVHLERTFAEWKDTIFSRPETGAFLSCGSCHMRGQQNRVIADAPGVPSRPRRHVHTFPGVDLALTPFPQQAEQAAAVQRFLDGSLRAELCVAELADGFVAEVLLDNVAAGHRFPSGAAQDRRVWIELIAYQAGAVVYQSGVVLDGQPVAALDDPDLWQLRDGAFKANGEAAHMFWDVAATKNDCADPSQVGCTIPGPVTVVPWEPEFGINHVTRRYPLSGVATGTPDRITLRVRLRPVGLDVLDDLIATGHLDPAVRDEMQTLDLIPNRRRADSMIEWTPEAADDVTLGGFTRQISGTTARCVGNAQG